MCEFFHYYSMINFSWFPLACEFHVCCYTLGLRVEYFRSQLVSPSCKNFQVADDRHNGVLEMIRLGAWHIWRCPGSFSCLGIERWKTSFESVVWYMKLELLAEI